MLICYRPWWKQVRQFFSYEIISPKEMIVNKTLEVPAFLDWRDHGALTKVKDQKKCGSCYAFAVTGAVEAHHFLKTGQLLELSEQQIVDCSIDSEGCNGGHVGLAYTYLINNGIVNSTDYPYEAKEEECQLIKKGIKKTDVKVYGYASFFGDEDELAKALFEFGPMSVVFDVSPKSLYFYKEGIYDDPKCDKNSPNHAALLMGYGHDDKTDLDYWLVKNSWGEEWGENGYIRIVRNKKMCGISNYLNFPIMNETEAENNVYNMAKFHFYKMEIFQYFCNPLTYLIIFLSVLLTCCFFRNCKNQRQYQQCCSC